MLDHTEASNTLVQFDENQSSKDFFFSLQTMIIGFSSVFLVSCFCCYIWDIEHIDKRLNYGKL